jgi:predicted DNA-binding transcriptional regulator AlpA
MLSANSQGCKIGRFVDTEITCGILFFMFPQINTPAQARQRPKREAWPRWLRREYAADYVSVSPSKFDAWRAQGIVPSPKRIGGVVLWDRLALDEAIEAIYYPDDELSKWDDVRA